MSDPTNSCVRLRAGQKIRGRRHPRLVKNFQISEKMRRFVGRMRMRLEDFDRTDRAIAAQFKRNCEEMKRILARKNIPEAEADRAIAQTLKAAVDHQLQSLRQSDVQQRRVHSARDVGKLIACLQKLEKAIAALPPVPKGKLNAIVAEHTAQFFDTETFAALIHALAGALLTLGPKRWTQEALDTIHQPVAGIVRTSPSELIELWETMPAETRRQVEQQVRDSAPKTSATEFLRQLVILLRRFRPQPKRGRLPTIQRRYIQRAAMIWTRLGLKVGRAYSGYWECNIESRFQRFASLALAAVSGDSVISRRQIVNAKKTERATKAK